MSQDPLHQFEISKLLHLKIGGLDLSYTNSAFALSVVMGICFAIFWFGLRKAKVVPSKLQVVAEAFVGFVNNMIKDNIGDTERGRKFLPFIFSLFMLILLANLLGMVPYFFTATSHIAVTFSLAVILFFVVVVVSIIKNGLLGFFGVFVPSGTPLLLAPLLFVIEFFSYLARPFTLALRLAGNMIAGHIVIKSIAGFVAGMSIFGIIPIAFLSVLIGFEIFIACLQAYIFSLLGCVYLNDALSVH